MMQIEYNVVIADTSCFILLDNIGELELLKFLFGRITTTSVIAQEFGAVLPEWVDIKIVSDTQFQSTLDVDAGEASAIALAIESAPSLVILDDDKARKLAKKLNLNITGSLGILLRAKREGLIPSIKPILEKIQQTNFRYSKKVLTEILFLAKE